MGTPASIKEHPIHPAIVGFPIGLWLFSLVADLIYLLGIGGVLWKTVAFYTMGAGIIGALIAAVPGFIDFLSISDRRVRQVGINHLTANLVATALFAMSFVLRWNHPLAVLPFAVSVAGIVALIVGGWLGGELVFIHRMGAAEKEPDSARSGARPKRNVA